MGIEDLISEAMEARKKAYVPYSNFAVGAALLTKSGKVYKGCNVENAAYSLSICAERVAVFKAVSAGEKDFEAIAIVSETMAMPCGACRQVLREFSDDIQVILADTEGERRVVTAKELLPYSFTAKDLPAGR